MLLGYPISEIAMLALWIVGAGILVGILAGLFGIGGGAIIVPVLYEVFRVIGVPEDVRIQLCIGTSLAIIVPTTIRSYLGHKKKGAVLPDVVRIWTLPAIFGVAIGSVTASFAPAPVFKIAFLFFVTFIAIRMLFGGDRWKLGDELPGRGDARRLRPYHRPVFLARRSERWRDIECGADALWSPNASGGRDIGRSWRSDHDCRRNRLHAGWLAAYGATAALVDRLRIAGWVRADGAGIELHDELWRAAGALAAAAKAGDCLRSFPDPGRAAICRKPDLAAATY